MNGSADIPKGSNAETSEGFPENRLAPPPEKNGSLLPDVGTEKAENRSLPPPAPKLVEANGSSFLSSLAPPIAPPTPLPPEATASEEEDCVLSSPPSSRWELVLKPLMLLTGLLEPACGERNRQGREVEGEGEGEREREREREKRERERS